MIAEPLEKSSREKQKYFTVTTDSFTVFDCQNASTQNTVEMLVEKVGSFLGESFSCITHFKPLRIQTYISAKILYFQSSTYNIKLSVAHPVVFLEQTSYYLSRFFPACQLKKKVVPSFHFPVNFSKNMPLKMNY